MADVPPVDVYLLPAIVGGGLGDIEETLAAGRRLAAQGWRTWLYRPPDRPLPRGVDGPWDWPDGIRRIHSLPPARAPAAVTVTPAWGVSAAPGRPGRLGRPGPWGPEAAEIESAYGSASTVHVSLEEFARTLPTGREDRERFREGGVAARQLPDRLRRSEAAGDRERFRAAFLEFRAFDRPNVLHLFATFEPDPGFAREFPGAVQCGPLWPRRYPARRSTRGLVRRREWVWYASPASSERIAGEVVRGLATVQPPMPLFVRTPRPWKSRFAAESVALIDVPLSAGRWRPRFHGADLRIVTGSRSLLEAIEAGGPFLYFNGVLGSGSASRRHRPEKIVAWLKAERARLPTDLARDLSDFARARRVRDVVSRAVHATGGWAHFPVGPPRGPFRAPFNDAGALMVAAARSLGDRPTEAEETVRRLRAGMVP